jgi:hypothetical protein
MATPIQGGLGQASAKPPAQAAKFDTDAVQAENLESQLKPTGLKDKVVDDLGDQREALNNALLRMRQSLDARKNRMFDPVLMQTAAGFLKPTKTGSFGESLGNAAENAGAASERQLLTDAENQKLELELLGREQEFRQQLGGDTLMSALLGGPKTGGAPPLAGAPSGAVKVAGTAPSVDLTTQSGQQQVVADVREGRIKVTDEILAIASRVAPKMLPFLQEMRKSQGEEDKIKIEREKLEKTTRKVVPRGLRTEREMNQGEYNQYLTAINQYQTDGDEQKLLNFYDKFGWLESEQARNRKIATEGSPSVISPAKTQSEMEAEKETATKTASSRAEAAGKMEARLGLQAEAAFENTNIAKDMIGYANNNPLVFDLMNRPGLGNAIARAIQEGVNVGNFSINLPVSTIKQYELSANDLTALQMFMQKSAQLQSRGRQLNRTPGEGSTSDYETKLLGGIYALPSDSQRAIILKSDALIMQGMFDEERFKLWTKKSKESGYTYNDFLIDEDYKKLKTDYRTKLDAVREENMDLLSPKKKDKKTPANAPANPPTNAPATKLSPNDSSVPPGYIKDPKTGVIRKKREGE